MWILITSLALGDIVVLALWLTERRSHQKSRKALTFWRRRSGLSTIALAATEAIEGDMVERLRVLRSEAAMKPRLPQIRHAQRGDAA